ncbi:MAG: glycosyltransferase family 39 protein [Planctomycetota bacterium]
MSGTIQTDPSADGCGSSADIWRPGSICVLFLILLGAVVLQVRDISSPWPDDIRGWTGAFYSNVARNYLHFGLKETRGGMVRSVNPRDPGQFRYIITHPPLLGWLVALSFKVFGYSERSARLVAVFCSIGSIALLYLIVKRSASTAAALCAAAIFAVLPMCLFFGSLVDAQGPIPLFFCLLVIQFYLRFLDKPSIANSILLLASFIPAAATDWPAYYLLPVLSAHYLLTTKRKNWKAILLPVFGVGLFVFYIFYAAYVRTGTFAFDLRRLAAAFAGRAGRSAEVADKLFTPGEWVDRVVLDWWPGLFTIAALFLVCVWLAVSIVKVARRRAGDEHWLFLMLLAFGLTHIVIFPQGAYIHPFWSYYLLPAVACAGGCVILGLAKLVSRGNRPVAALIALASLGGLAAWSLINDAELKKDTRYDFAFAGRQTSGVLPKDVVLVCDIEQRYGFDFHIRVPIERALVVPANLQLMRDRPEKRYLFMTHQTGPAHFFKGELVKALLKEHRQRTWSAVGILASLVSFDYERFIPYRVQPPKIIHKDRKGNDFFIRWENPDLERVTGYRIYYRYERERFYTEYADIGIVHRHQINNDGGWIQSVIVVALFRDSDAIENEVENETGFSEEIATLP